MDEGFLSADAAYERGNYEEAFATFLEVAHVWTELLGREVRYAGGDLYVFENAMKGRAPAWLAYDLRAMMRRLQVDGAVATAADIDRLAAPLGRLQRSYRDFARETVRNWQS
jgi:hypothetical protein